MSRLRTPFLSIVIGEGGSGGALGIGVGDRVAILEYAYYSVITPEGCAAILWRDAAMAAEAAKSLRLTPKDMLELGVVDEIIPEPLGGAHRDAREMAATLERKLVGDIRRTKRQAIDKLLDQRYQRVRRIGPVLSGRLRPASPSQEPRKPIVEK